MKAIELHLGSPIYVATADEIREYNVNRINFIDGKVNIICGNQYSGIEMADVEPDATQASEKRYPGKLVYFNIDDAEIAQLLARERAIKYAFQEMERYQKTYQDLVAKYLFAEPSKPVKR